jgi:nitrogen regulatory protein P-II 2
MERAMKIVMAIIKPFKLDEVRDALTGIGIQGSDGDRSEGLWPPERAHRNLPRNRIRSQLPAQAEDRSRCRKRSVDKVVEVISGAAKTGQIGDGKIFVYSIDQVVRIRTGETDAEAL